MNAKGVYTVEANEELKEYSNSKMNYIDFGGNNIRVSDKEAIQSLYNMTLVLDKTKLVDPVF